ncbi:PREDICTED: uncharacterized protein LOC106741543 [Dinoponera quadriceps]|uniref:Uncharacterized protein LOC106741543 n=1 Tax=Dinoponera quadriceps TaxID=609295 RepID=A0A6P3WSS0_DINQU|nr:PREDICTED: uncharacterized protein LOC106741543 [Dinoponera quadriceps]
MNGCSDMSQNLTTRVVKYIGRQTPLHYNKCFYPNICHVCKSPNGGALLLCGRCRMISYCSVKHKMQHMWQHEDICSIIEKLLKENPWYYTRRLTASEWLRSREELKNLVINKLHRPLETYEWEMFMRAKSCFICHRQANLRACGICFSANYCSRHSEDFHRYHRSICKELLVALNSCILMGITKQSMKFKKVSNFTWSNECPLNMLEFIGLYLHRNNRIWATNPWTIDLFKVNDFKYSTYASDSLTLYYGMKDANLVHLLSKPVCVIHIVHPRIVCKSFFQAWELSLHLLCPDVQKIIIVLIGSELSFRSRTLKMCAECRARKKSIIIEYYPKMYENYVVCTEFRRPNNQNCPLLFTTLFKWETEQLVTNFYNVLGTTTQPLLVTKNRFSSLIPNVCHVCKSVNGGILIWCSRCSMISYPELDHKRTDRNQHKQICKVLVKCLEERPWNKTSNLTEWYSFTQELAN